LPSSTGSPSLIRTSATLPSQGASIGISIFIDSRITSTWPSFTLAPAATSTFQTVPVMCARTSVAMSSALFFGENFAKFTWHQLELERHREAVDEAVVTGVIFGESAGRALAIKVILDDGAVAIFAGVNQRDAVCVHLFLIESLVAVA